MKNEAMYRELVELLTTDSASGKESAIADKLEVKLRELGCTVTRDNAGETFGGECGNLIGILEGELDGSVMLSSHMDRVPNGYGIQPVEKDGILYSDGTTILAADDISGVCAILEGVRRAKASGKPQPRNEIIFSVAEETGLRFVNGAAGMYHLNVTLTGRPAHAGNEPEKGIDAGNAMCDMLATLKQGRLDPLSTANFPMHSTGTTSRNVVCDLASFKGEARSRDLQKLEDYVAYFEDHCNAVAKKHNVGIQLEKIQNFLPFLIPEDDQVLQVAKTACEKLDLPFRVEVGGGGMDANIYNAQGMATVGVATGYTKNHTKAEQLVLEDFFRSGELCQTLIETFAESCASK